MAVTAQGYAKLADKLQADIAVLEGGYSVEAALPYVNTGIILAMADMDYSKVVEPDQSDLRQQDERCNKRVDQLIAETGELWRSRFSTRKELLAKAKYVAMLIAGMAITAIGADWLVDGATGLARMIDIPEAIIGLSIVAIGTSAPELVTTIVATLRDERDVAIGNLLGSSIYNILLVLGLAALAAPTGLTVTRQLQLFDIPLMTLVALACVPVFLTGRRISRLEGGLGVSAYMIYLIWLVLFRA